MMKPFSRDPQGSAPSGPLSPVCGGDGQGEGVCGGTDIAN